MIFSDPTLCPTCGRDSEVTTTRYPYRYRRCLNRGCQKRWRTQEVYQHTLDDLMLWHDRVSRDGASAARQLTRAVDSFTGEVRGFLEALEMEIVDDESERAQPAGL